MMKQDALTYPAVTSKRRTARCTLADDQSPAAMYAQLAKMGLIDRLLELARDEDLGSPPSDVTSELAIAPDAAALARIVAREPCTVAGLAVAPDLLRVFHANCTFSPAVSDGDSVAAGAVLGAIQGHGRDLLKIERTVLNLLGRLSGVATNTAQFVARIEGAGARLLDTRKTTPGLRALEKYAVRCGGGQAHRLGLYDAVLLKDNHFIGMDERDIMRFVTDVARQARCDERVRFVEVEVDTLDQLRAVLAAPDELIDITLLDNMTTNELEAAVRIRDASGRAMALEASGGVTLDTVLAIAMTGVERVSVGALTRDAKTVDIALDFQA